MIFCPRLRPFVQAAPTLPNLNCKIFNGCHIPATFTGNRKDGAKLGRCREGEPLEEGGARIAVRRPLLFRQIADEPAAAHAHHHRGPDDRKAAVGRRAAPHDILSRQLAGPAVRHPASPQRP